MTRNELVSATVLRPGAHTLLSVIGAIALIFAVIVAVNLWIGEEQLPREIRGTTPVLLGITAGLAVATAALWRRSRRRLTLVDTGERQVLEIDDHPPLVLSGPFTVRTGWMWIRGGRGVSTLLVQAVFVDGDRVPLMLTEEWGALSTPPPGPEGLVTSAPPERVFRSGGIRFLAELVEKLDRPAP